MITHRGKIKYNSVHTLHQKSLLLALWRRVVGAGQWGPLLLPVSFTLMEQASSRCPLGPRRMTGQQQASGPLRAVSSVGHSMSRVPLDGRAGGRWPIEGGGSSQAYLWWGAPSL